MSIYSTSTSNRMTGLVSGMDIDELVKGLTIHEQNKVDGAKQSKQTLEWTQEIYRSIIEDINFFSSKYFDVLSPNYLFSPSNLAPFGVSIIDGTSAGIDFINATRTGTYKLDVQQLAESAKIDGNSMTIHSGAKSTFVIAIDDDNNEFKIGDHTVEIDSKASGYKNTNELASEINKQLRNMKLDDGHTAFDEVEVYVEGGVLYGREKIYIAPAEDGEKHTLSIDVQGVGEVEIDMPTGSYTHTQLANTINSRLHTELKKMSEDVEEGEEPPFDYDDFKDYKFTFNDETNTFEFINSDDETLDITVDHNVYTREDDEAEWELDSTSRLDLDGYKTKVDVSHLAEGEESDTNSRFDSVEGGLKFTEEKIYQGFNDKINLVINGEKYTITIPPGDYGDEKNEEGDVIVSGAEKLAEAINGAMDDEIKSMITIEASNGRLVFSSEAEGSIRISGNAGGVIGIDGEVELGFDTTTKVADIMGPDVDTISFKINGISFEYDLKDVDANITFAQIIRDIERNADVKMYYSERDKRFVITSKEEGVDSTITLEDGDGGFLAKMFQLEDGRAESAGQDAKFTLKGPGDSGDPQVLYRASNQFTMDGLAFDLKDVGETTFTVESDTDKTVEVLTEVVDDYNEIIDKVFSLSSERKNYDYPPLTAEQRKDMSEEEIRLWEEQAKKGLVGNDPALRGMISNMRNCFLGNVDGTNMTIFEIGFNFSSDYMSGGQITLDEEKLRAALVEDPDQVMDLLMGSSETHPTYNPDYSTEEKKTRYNEQGVFRRLDDVFKDYTRHTLSSSGSYGILVEKSGVEGRASENNNYLSRLIDQENKNIEKFERRLTEREEYWYKRFSVMETSLARLSAQGQMFFME